MPSSCNRRVLGTSLWKIWIATILLVQKKTNGIWRMRTNTMANQEYRPHPPAQFPIINLHVAECPQMWILLIHLQFLLPNRPWCPQSYLLHWLLRSDYHSSPSLMTTSKPGINWKLGTALLSGTPSSIASVRSSLATLTPKGDVLPTSFFSCTQYFK